MSKFRKPKTIKQLLAQSQKDLAKAKANVQKAEMLVAQCWDLLGSSAPN
jgi:hypothetical protein